jgi:hypothetical protein
MFNTAHGSLSATADQVTNLNNELHILKVMLIASPRLLNLNVVERFFIPHHLEI